MSSSGKRLDRPARGVASEPVEWGLSAQRWTVLALVPLVVLAVLPASSDPVNVIKLTVLAVGVIVLVAVGALRVISTGMLRLPLGPAPWAVAALLVTSAAATLRAQAHGVALWGDYRRNIGFVLYACGVVLFLVLVRIADVQFVRALAVAAAATGGVLGLYAVSQWLGIDAIAWKSDYVHSIATLGNPDFAASALAITLPFTLWGALFTRWAPWQRCVAAVAAVLVLLGIVATHALQGLAAAGAAVAVLLLAWLCSAGGRLRRVGVPVWCAVAGLLTLTVIAGLARVGPAAAFGRNGTVEIRRHYWDAAWSMFTHHPVLGVGTSMFGSYFRGYRSESAVRTLGPANYVDAPHSVPLSMLATGGVLVGLAYVGFVVAVVFAMVRALRSDDPSRVLLAGAFAGAWVAYQAQSAISIDMVPLLTLHIVAAAGLVVLGGGVRLRAVPLARAPKQRGAASAGPGAPAVAGVVVVALVLAWFAINPLRGDVAAHSAEVAAVDRGLDAAVAPIKTATRAAPWVTMYWLRRAQYVGGSGDVNAGLAALRNAYRANRRDSDVVVSLAQVHAAIKRNDDAIRWYRYAIRLDPHNPELRAALKKLQPAG